MTDDAGDPAPPIVPDPPSVPDLPPSLPPALPPSLPPVAPPSLSPAAPAAPVVGGAAGERLVAERVATRNVPSSPPKAKANYGLPSAPTDEDGKRPEFVRPELEPMGAATTALLVGRGLFVLAALLIGIAARRSIGGRTDAFWPVVFSAGVFVLVGVGGLVFWSASLADNAQRLKARCATPRGMVRIWAFPIGWVVFSVATYLQIDVDGDLDPLPGVAAVGWAIALAIAYARLQGVFRGLSRTPPNLWLSAYPLDMLAFGLVWWRLTSWPSPVGGELDHVRTTANVAFGAAALLALNALVFGWLALRGNNGIYERLGRLEARHRRDEGMQPQWFQAGLAARARPAAPVEARPLITTSPLSGIVAGLHVLWGVSVVVFGAVLIKLAFDYTDLPVFIDENLALDSADETRVAVVGGIVGLVYVAAIVTHGVWAVLAAINGRRITVHSPNPGTFALVFIPMPVLLVTGLLIGGTLGYWVVIAGLAVAFFALLLVNQMLMALSARLGGQLSGFGRWTLLITLTYLVGAAENFFFSQSVAQLGFYAAATLVQGVLIAMGGVVGFRAMRALEDTMVNHRRIERAEPE